MAQELKAINVVATADVNPDVVDNLGCTEWAGYDKDEVDAVLTEKDTEIAELTAKLENVQASMYADAVDLGMENRRLKRALWLARAMRAEAQWNRLLRDAGICFAVGRCKEWDEFNTMQKKWQGVERKCRAKAEEYK